jgi:ribosomal protein S27AE
MSDPKRFDMNKPPKRQNSLLRVLTWILSFPVVWLRKLKITKRNMKGLKPPYLLLCTHKSFIDFMVTTACIFPHRANYVVAIDGFIGRENLLRYVGCVCKRKFTNDIRLVYHLRQVIKNGDIAVVYPEARYSLAGTNACLPESLGKLAKLLKVPVVMLHMHGDYIYSPVWNLKKRPIPLEAEMEQILSAEDVIKLPAADINVCINKAFEYDEFRWQKNNGVRVRYKERAKGLHKVLYRCVNCGAEFKMTSEGDTLRCGCCGSEWKMSELGELVSTDGKKIHIPDWYQYERRMVREEIETGTYNFSSAAAVDSLPNAKGYVRLGEALLTHDMNGFRLEGELGGGPFLLEKPPSSMYSCHIEYEYMGKGDCIDLSTLEDTYYIYPKTEEWAATKIALATEELYNYRVLKKDRSGS